MTMLVDFFGVMLAIPVDKMVWVLVFFGGLIVCRRWCFKFRLALEIERK